MRRTRPAKKHTPVDKSVLAFGVETQQRDQKYRVALRSERCLITGLHGSEDDPVEAMHIGTAGKGLKIDDRCMLPIRHSYHQLGHQQGEISMLRRFLPDDVLRAALRAYARELYQQITTKRMSA